MVPPLPVAFHANVFACAATAGARSAGAASAGGGRGGGGGGGGGGARARPGRRVEERCGSGGRAPSRKTGPCTILPCSRSEFPNAIGPNRSSCPGSSDSPGRARV